MEKVFIIEGENIEEKHLPVGMDRRISLVGFVPNGRDVKIHGI